MDEQHKKYKLKYIGGYEGTIPWCGIHVKPGDVIEVLDELAEKLLETGQFELVKEVT